MRHVKLSELRPGMVTDQDIFAPGGRLLLPAGTTLTERHIRMLAARDIGHSSVTGRTAPPGAGIPAPWDEASERRLLKRLEHNDPAHPLIAELMRLCRLRAGAA